MHIIVLIKLYFYLNLSSIIMILSCLIELLMSIVADIIPHCVLVVINEMV